MPDSDACLIRSRVALLGDVDALDGADRHAAGLDLVALHELAGVHELRGHAVAAVAPEQQDCDSDYR
jgi:hypothetical protein